MTALIPIEPANALTVFTEPQQLQKILDSIAADVRQEVLDPSTAKGRKEIASLAFKVARSKQYLDGEGKRLVDEMKELPRKIDAQRKAARDFLDNLRDEIRAPLDQWEAAEAERKRLEEEAAAAEKLREQIERDHEVALMMNELFDAERERKAEQAKREQAEHEERIRQEAEARAKKEAELAIENARLQQERAERQRIEAERRAAEAEERAKLAAERAEREGIEAKQRAQEQAERERQEKLLADQRELEKRQADQAHRRAINRAALADILANVPELGEGQAKALILAIAAGKISGITINY